jgi:hypothetical protein
MLFPMAMDHTLIVGQRHVYKRENCRFWQCSAYLAVRNHRTTTKQQEGVMPSAIRIVG